MRGRQEWKAVIYKLTATGITSQHETLAHSASSALGRMSWIKWYFQQESSGTHPHRHWRITASKGVQGVQLPFSAALSPGPPRGWSRRARCSRPVRQRRTCHSPRQCHSWQPADTRRQRPGRSPWQWRGPGGSGSASWPEEQTHLLHFHPRVRCDVNT